MNITSIKKWIISLGILVSFVACGAVVGGNVDTTITSEPVAYSHSSGKVIVSGTLSISSGIDSTDLGTINSINLSGIRFEVDSSSCSGTTTSLPLV